MFIKKHSFIGGEYSFMNNSRNVLIKKICAGIVTYNPDILRLKKNISNIANQVKTIIIFDNGSENINNIIELISCYSNVYILNNPENKGIAYALNKIFEWGKKNNFEWVLTLDQDSVVLGDLIDNYEFISEKNAIVAPNILYKDNEQYKEIHDHDYEYVSWAITSASLTQLKAWEEIGGFDEYLFIDKVDYDFCVRLRCKGYFLVRTYKVTLDHELGNLNCIRLFGKTIYVTHHSPQRKYYMVRNSIYLKKKLGSGTPARDVIKLIAKTLLFEKKKMLNFSFIYRGIVDGAKS